MLKACHAINTGNNAMLDQRVPPLLLPKIIIIAMYQLLPTGTSALADFTPAETADIYRSMRLHWGPDSALIYTDHPPDQVRFIQFLVRAT